MLAVSNDCPGMRSITGSSIRMPGQDGLHTRPDPGINDGNSLTDALFIRD